ncbi:MAG: EAL domain-containing protein [Coriobacteriales bacterium]|nr:EAL domain-containing protein [Coriobacteriales bacterium]
MTDPITDAEVLSTLSTLLDRETFYLQCDRIGSFLPQGQVAILFITVSNIKGYNTRRGIAAGDRMLARVARRIIRTFPQGLAARHSADSFMLLSTSGSIEQFAEQLNSSYTLEDGVDEIVVKVGYCVNSPDYAAREAAVRAEYACRSILDKPDVFCQEFDKDIELSYFRRSYIIDHLDAAIARGEIKDYYQPIVRVLTGKVCEVEVLARWESERFGSFMPNEFVGPLEEQRLIHKLDVCMVRLACEHWREANRLRRAVPFGINLSRLDFELCDIFAEVNRALADYEVPVEACHIEITESALSSNSKVLWQGVNKFRDAGFSIYMDDFGTGYSSLRTLDDFAFDVIKLDMTLLSEVEHNERARVIVSDAVNMVKRLDMQTLCEGVETEEQLSFLAHVGCEKAQGYYFGKPMTRAKLMERLSKDSEMELPSDNKYFDVIGQVNMSDGSQANIQGIESVSFLGREPLAVLELKGPQINLLTCNVAFTRFLESVEVYTFENLLTYVNGGSSEMREKIVFAASKARATGQETSIDFVANGSYCGLLLSHIAHEPYRDAYLVRALDVSRYTPIIRTGHLERALRFLYTIYKRLDLFDLEDGSYRNLYVNSSLYSSNITHGQARDAIKEFCERCVHPEDQQLFMDFYNLDTFEERIKRSYRDHLSCAVRTLSDTMRYTDQVFMLIPMVQEGRRQVLSSLRDLDKMNLPGEVASQDASISDSVPLTGVLDVCDRQIFWKDAHRRFLGANQAFLDYYGFDSVAAILGKNDEDMGWHEHVDPYKSDELRVLQGDHTNAVPGTCYARGVNRKIEASKRPLYRDGKVVGLVGYFRDVTDEAPKEDASEDQMPLF